VEAERFVIETMLTDLDQRALGLLRALDHQTVADCRVELVEIGDQFVHDAGLDFQFGEDNIIFVVRLLTDFVSESRIFTLVNIVGRKLII